MALLEVFCELLLTIICFGIGIFIISLFGVDFESLDMDHDLIILIGLVSFFVVLCVVLAGVNAFVQWIKKIIRGKHK